MRRFLLVLGLTFPLVATARAQLRRGTGGVLLPATSTAAPDDVYALETNPAALAFLRGWEVAYLHADAINDENVDSRGDAIYGATQLPFRLAVGGSLDWRRPTMGNDSGRLSLGLAWSRNRQLAVGAALRFVVSDDPRFDGVTALDVGVTWRPTSWLGASVVAHDLLAPLGLVTSESADVPGTFAGAVQLRPFGDDSLALEGVVAVDTDGHVGVRGIGSARLPRLGRLFASVEVDDLREDADLRMMGGLALDWDRIRVEGAMLAGTDVHPTGWLAGARLRSAEREGLPSPAVIDDIELKSAGARGVLTLVSRLDDDLYDPEVKGVLLRIRDADFGLAVAQELRMAIAELERAGKPVVCHVEFASGSEMYACSAASRTWVEPAGSVRMLGPRFNIMLYGEILQNVGIRADFVRIGRFKSAVEQYTNGRMSEGARSQRELFLDDIYRRMVQDMAIDRSRDRADVRAWIDEGLFVSWEAAEQGVVHELVDESELGAKLREVYGRHRRRSTPPTRVPTTIGTPRRIAVLMIDGSIVDGDNVDIPILEIHQSGGRTITRTIDALAADSSIAAVVVRVDSPGGSAMASEQIWRALKRLRARKPVICSMGALAASGGYYVASAAEEIWADPATLTGSIGIFFGKVDVVPIAEQVGITLEQLGRGRRAGADSLYRPFTADERAALADKIRIWYRLFLRRVAESRDMELDEVHRLAQGRVWTGDAAMRVGLVDHLGGFQSALARARERAGLGVDAEVVVIPNRPSSLIDYVLAGVASEEAPVSAAQSEPVSAPLRRAAELASLLAHTGAGIPLAFMDASVSLH